MGKESSQLLLLEQRRLYLGWQERESLDLKIIFGVSLNKALLGQRWGKWITSSSNKNIHLFWSTGQSSESKPQTPSQTKVESSNIVKTAEENGNLSKVRIKANREDNLEKGTIVSSTNVPLSLQIPMKTQSAPATPTPPPLPPPAAPRKNKAAMCKPLMQNRGVSCKVEMKSKGSQTGKQNSLIPRLYSVLGLQPYVEELG